MKNMPLQIELLSETRFGRNFRIICEEWPRTSKPFCDQSFWPEGIIVAPWEGPIRPLSEVPRRFRKFVGNFPATQTEEQLKNFIERKYRDKNVQGVSVIVEDFAQMQKEPRNHIKNFVVEISLSNDPTRSDATLEDLISEPLSQAGARCRTWNGVMPSVIVSRSSNGVRGTRATILE